MKSRLLPAMIAAGALAGTACNPESKPGPPCVDGFAAGQRLSVRLGATYDATSDFLYDGQVTSAWVDARTPSCAGVDGLATGAVVTFVLRELVDTSFLESCAPWGADLEPESLTDPHFVVTNSLPVRPTQTIAVAPAEGTLLDGRKVLNNRGLFAPSGDFRGALVPRQLPPLVVSRYLAADNGAGSACNDDWLASWEEPPP